MLQIRRGIIFLIISMSNDKDSSFNFQTMLGILNTRTFACFYTFDLQVPLYLQSPNMCNTVFYVIL